jgi:glucan phosphoethanolaminetransferase (alkaline phosphatase superfamily)
MLEYRTVSSEKYSPLNRIVVVVVVVVAAAAAVIYFSLSNRMEADEYMCNILFIYGNCFSIQFSIIQIFEKRETTVSEQEKAAQKRPNEVNLSAG